MKKRFYDAIITDPPYNIKAKVVTTDDEGRRPASREGANPPLFSRRAGEAPSELPLAAVAARPDKMVDVSQQQAPREVDDCSEWRAGEGARAVAYANDLVGEVVWSLLALARYSLKPGGRLCFFLPLRGAEARLDKLPTALLDRLSEGGEGKRLSLIYATKQRMTSPNLCRWLLILEKGMKG